VSGSCLGGLRACCWRGDRCDVLPHPTEPRPPVSRSTSAGRLVRVCDEVHDDVMTDFASAPTHVDALPVMDHLGYRCKVPPKMQERTRVLGQKPSIVDPAPALNRVSRGAGRVHPDAPPTVQWLTHRALRVGHRPHHSRRPQCRVHLCRPKGVERWKVQRSDRPFLPHNCATSTRVNSTT
jgi:hypothetical protein